MLKLAISLAVLVAVVIAPPIGPYSPFIKTSSGSAYVYFSGQIGLDASGSLVPGGLLPEIDQAFKNLDQLLSDSGVKKSTEPKQQSSWPEWQTSQP